MSRQDSHNREREPEPQHNLSGRGLFTLSLVSSAVYLVLAWLIFHYFHGAGLGTAFGHGFSVTGQLVAGMAAGGVAAGLVRFFADRSPVSDVLRDYYLVRVIERTEFSALDRIQLSLFAGAGEELLFRGAIQPLLGLWITSALFVGIHGYFKFDSAGHWLFGALMFGLSSMLGLLFDSAGLISAMTAHAVYDMVMLWWVAGREL